MSINSKKKRDQKRRKSTDHAKEEKVSCSTLVIKSEALLQEGETQKALDLALLVATKHEGHVAWEQACHIALEILLERHDATSALPLAERLIRHTAACPLGSYQLARAVQLTGNHTRALNLFQNLFATKHSKEIQDIGPSHVYFAESAAISQRLDVLSPWLEQWANQSQKDSDSQYYWALVLFEIGQTGEARRTLKDLLESETSDLEKAAILHELGICAQEEGEIDQARSFYLEASSIAPIGKRAVSLNMLASLEIDAGKPEQALTWARRALEEAPNDVSTRVNLAAAFAYTGQFKAAVAEYRIILSALPDPRFQQSLAFALLEAGEHEEAIKELRSLLDSNFNKGITSVNLGVALSQRGQTGDLEEALALHRRALEGGLAGAQSATVHFNIINLLVESNNLEGALQHAASISPEDWPKEQRAQLAKILHFLKEKKKEYIKQNLELIDDIRGPRYVKNISININVQAGGIAHTSQDQTPIASNQLVSNKKHPTRKKPADTQIPSKGALPDYDPTQQPWFVSTLPKFESRSRNSLGSIRNNIHLVLMTVKETEMNAALAKMTSLDGEKNVLRVHVEQETYYIGRFGSHNVALTMCMPGSINRDAAILATKHALDFWKPRAVIMVGFAFGKDPAQQKIADILIAEQIISYEPQKIGSETIPRGPIPPSSSILLNRFRHNPHWTFERPDGTKCEAKIGPILSGEKLVDNPKTKAKYFKQYPQAIGGEMEGSGLWAAADRAKVDWILVKAICDWGDGTKHKRDQPLAAAAAVSLVHYVLSDETALDGLVDRIEDDKSQSKGIEQQLTAPEQSTLDANATVRPPLSAEQKSQLDTSLKSTLWPVRRKAYEQIKQYVDDPGIHEILKLLAQRWDEKQAPLIPEDRASIIDIWDRTKQWTRRDELLELWQSPIGENKDVWGRIWNFLYSALRHEPEPTLSWLLSKLGGLLRTNTDRPTSEILALVALATRGEFGDLSAKAWDFVSSIYELFKDQEAKYSPVAEIREALHPSK